LTYEQLMQHAYEIQRTANQKTMDLYRKSSDGLSPRQIEEVRVQTEKSFADVPSLFQAFVDTPAPTSFDPIIERIDAALRRLSTGNGPRDTIDGEYYHANEDLDPKMTGVGGFVAGWSGAAAMAFKANFVDRFPAVVRNQFIAAAVLRVALKANREVWVTTRKDIDEIAEKTIEALDGVGRRCGKNDWHVRFTIVSAVASLASVSLSGGTLTAATILGTASQVGGEATDGAQEVEYHGESPAGVINSMREAISKLTKDIASSEWEIKEYLRKAYSIVYNNRGSFVSPRPALIDATASNIKGPRYMGYSDD
jgi:hypothetical protein